MTVTVIFYGPLEKWAGKRTYLTDGSTIRQVLKNLENQIGKSILNFMVNSDSDSIKSHFHILLNGVDTESLNGLDQEVNSGDTITCVPPVGGGRTDNQFLRKKGFKR